jgi:hypothetical protein
MDDLTVPDVFGTLGPYMRDHFRRDIRFQHKLTVTAFRGYVDICVGQVNDRPGPPSLPSMRFTVSIIAPPPDPLTKKLTVDILAHVPREHVVSLKTECSLEVPEESFVAMSNIETLRLHDADISDGFLRPNPDGQHANAKLFPSLRLLHLLNVTADDAGWGPLTAYLVHQTSDHQAVSLELTGYCSYMPPKVSKEIRDLVKAFVYDPTLDTEDSDEGEYYGDFVEDELESLEDDDGQ